PDEHGHEDQRGPDAEQPARVERQAVLPLPALQGLVVPLLLLALLLVVLMVLLVMVHVCTWLELLGRGAILAPGRRRCGPGAEGLLALLLDLHRDRGVLLATLHHDLVLAFLGVLAGGDLYLAVRDLRRQPRLLGRLGRLRLARLHFHFLLVAGEDIDLLRLEHEQVDPGGGRRGGRARTPGSEHQRQRPTEQQRQTDPTHVRFSLG